MNQQNVTKWCCALSSCETSVHEESGTDRPISKYSQKIQVGSVKPHSSDFASSDLP